MDLIEIETNLFVALEEAKGKLKGCWREDVEDKSYYEGEIFAYSNTLRLVRKIIERNNIVKHNEL